MRYLQLLFIFLIIACQARKDAEKKPSKPKILFKKQNSPVNYSIRGVSVVDSTTAWLSGAEGTILRTINGGNTWELLPLPDFDSLDFRDVEAFSAAEALVVSAGFPARIYRTVNEGQSWQLVYENLDSAAFMNSVAFKNNNEGVVLGDQLNGRHLILKTDDGGKTWHQIDSNKIPKPLAIENGFAASGSCIAIDENGTYYIGLGGEKSRVFYSNNGISWKVVETPMRSGSASSGIYSIAAGNNIIMAVGGDYTKADSSHFPIFTFKKGKPWQKTLAEVSGYRSVIDYSTACNCWLSAGTNGIDVSYNNGSSWERIDSLNLNTLQFSINGKNGFAANSLGEIYRIVLKKD